MAAKVQQSITINQPIERVFAFLTDPTNTPKWQLNVLESKVMTEGPTHVGTRIIEVRSFLGRKIESTSEITELEPNKRLVFKSVFGPFPYKGTYSFESLGKTTRVTLDAEAEPKGFYKLAEGILAGGMKKQLETDVAQAKQLLESEA